MYRKLLVALNLILVSATSALSWGTVTHVYVGQRVAEELNHYQWNYLNLQSIYGAIAPDLGNTLPKLKSATHYDYQSVVDEARGSSQSAFAAGWVTHNEVWGADYYAHILHPVRLTEPGYVRDEKNLALVEAMKDELWPSGGCPFTDEQLMGAAEIYIEAGVDLLLEEHDVHLGRKAILAASRRNPSIPSLLSRAYPDLVGGVLLASEEAFRLAVIAYAEVIALPRPRDKKAIASGVVLLARSLGVEMTLEQSLYFLETAMGLCSGEEDNYFLAIETIIELIIDHISPSAAPARPEPRPGPAILWGDIRRVALSINMLDGNVSRMLWQKRGMRARGR